MSEQSKQFKRKALGSGLDALLGGDLSLNVSDTSSGSSNGIRNIPADKLKPNPDQPRERFDQDALAELAESIRQQGVIQPILAEERADGSFMLIAGERRWRASKLAGLDEVPVIIREFSPEQKLEIAHEFYASIIIDDAAQCPLLLFSTGGGSGIEDRVKSENIIQHHLDAVHGLPDYVARNLLRRLDISGVTQRNLAMVPAPSTSAASYRVPSIACSRARIMSIANGK